MSNRDGSTHQSSSGSGSGSSPGSSPGSQTVNNRSTPTYQSLNRTWPTEANPRGQTEHQQAFLSGSSPAMQRWAAETMREQPWNGVGSFKAWPTVATGQVGKSKGSSAGAEAGSEYRH